MIICAILYNDFYRLVPFESNLKLKQEISNMIRKLTKEIKITNVLIDKSLSSFQSTDLIKNKI